MEFKKKTKRASNSSVMRTYYVYILKCSDGSYYTDFTSNLDSQIKSHQTGKQENTVGRLPVEPVFHTEFKVPLFAIEAKRQIKRWSRDKKEALINGEFEKLPNLV